MRATLIVLLCVLLAAATSTAEAADEVGAVEDAALAPVSYPVLTSNVVVPTPEGALPEGTPPTRVLLQIVIDDAGDVVEASVKDGSGLPLLDEAAVEAAYSLSFLPAEQNGQAVTVTIDFPFVFFSEDPPPPPIVPARLAGEVQVRGSKEALVRLTIALVAAELKPRSAAEQLRIDGEIGAQKTAEQAQALRARLDAEWREDPRNYELADEPSAVTETDEAGAFAFDEIPPGSYLAVLDTTGYEVSRFLEIFDEGTERKVLYRLTPVRIDEVVVRERREDGTPSRVLTREELRRFPGAGSDPVAAIKALPGVAVEAQSQAGAATGGALPEQTPVVRGANNEDTVAFLDGLPTPILIHSIGTETIATDDLVGNAYLLPAAGRARFGDHTGGIIGLDLRSPRADRVGGFIEPGLLQSSAAIEGRITDLSRFYIGFRRSYNDWLIAAVLPEDTPIDFRTAPFLQDQQVFLEADLSEELSLKVRYVGTLDGINILSREDEEGNQDQTFRRTTDLNRWGLYLDLDRGMLKNRAQVAFSLWGTNFDIQNIGRTRDRHQTLHVADRLQLPLWPWLTLDTGFLVEIDHSRRVSRQVVFGREDTGPQARIGELSFRSGVEDITRPWISAWLAPSFRPLDGLALTPELRIDWWGALGAFRAQPRLQIVGKPARSLTVTVAGGRYEQSPSLDEINAITGNPDLEPEGAWHGNLGLLIEANTYLSIDLQGYVKFLDNYVVSSKGDDSFAGFATGSEAEEKGNGLSNDGIGRIYGAEAFLRFGSPQRVGLSGWASYSLSWSQRKDFPDEAWRWFSVDRRHQVTLLAQVSLPGEIQIGARWFLQTGKPDTPIVDSTFYADTGEFVPVFGEVNSTRTGPYHQLDLRFDKRFRKDSYTFDLFVEVTNVYYAQTTDFRIPSYDYREADTFPVIPGGNAGVRLEF
jgi:TonB family protein